MEMTVENRTMIAAVNAMGLLAALASRINALSVRASCAPHDDEDAANEALTHIMREARACAETMKAAIVPLEAQGALALSALEALGRIEETTNAVYAKEQPAFETMDHALQQARDLARGVLHADASPKPSAAEASGITLLCVVVRSGDPVDWYFDVASEAEAAREHLRKVGADWTEQTVEACPAGEFITDAAELWQWLSKKVFGRAEEDAPASAG